MSPYHSNYSMIQDTKFIQTWARNAHNFGGSLHVGQTRVIKPFVTRLIDTLVQEEIAVVLPLVQVMVFITSLNCYQPSHSNNI